jgi:branched-chain amino acid transport system ATP-binding protein
MRILAKEHLALRALARIIAMEAEILRRGEHIDPQLLEHIAAYIEAFPNRIHHPKEEDHLFRLMRARSPERVSAILDRLLDEHTRENESIEALVRAIDAYRSGTADAASQLSLVAGNYARHLERHIVVEDTQAFPLAKEVLNEADWQEIDAAFLANDDPLVSGDEHSRFNDLHRRIMAMGALPPGL